MVDPDLPAPIAVQDFGWCVAKALAFGWPGIGLTLLKGIANHDKDLTVIMVLCLGLFFILINFLLELSYLLIDPRLREKPAHIVAGAQKNPLIALKSAFSDLADLLSDNPLVNWLKRSRTEIIRIGRSDTSGPSG